MNLLVRCTSVCSVLSVCVCVCGTCVFLPIASLQTGSVLCDQKHGPPLACAGDWQSTSMSLVMHDVAELSLARNVMERGAVLMWERTSLQDCSSDVGKLCDAFVSSWINFSYLLKLPV